MNRREFLLSALGVGALYSLGGIPILGRVASADGFAPITHRVLVNLMMEGGPDFRHLFPPPFEAGVETYGYRHWEAKASAHAISQNASAYQARWENDYFHVSDGDTEFGILKSCGWLKDMWDAGNVAIVCNAIGATTRNHSHCQLVMDQGNRTSGPNDFNRSGWGGRLSVEAGGNILALTRTPRAFCNGPHPTNTEGFDNSNLISATDMRNMGLFDAQGYGATNPRAKMTRALKSYYQAKRQEMDPDSIYYQFIEHERIAREFGTAIDARLSTIPLPAALAGLTQGDLASSYLGKQIQNLYDALACNDIVALRVASLELGSWDSHRKQRALIEPHLNDLFGAGKSLDTLYQELPTDATDNMVMVAAGEFGRQLKSNGTFGSDHGKGNSIVVIGNDVQGGIYGNMFPEDELERLEGRTADITGLTDLDHVFTGVCDWASPNSGSIVFPDLASAAIESGVSLNQLLG